MSETTTPAGAYHDHKSRLIQWLTDEFYNWARTLPDEKLAYLHDNFDVIRNLPLVAAQDSTGEDPAP